MAGITRIGSLIAVVVVAMTVAEAQTLPSCAVMLVACADSLNTTTTPPPTCCLPLQDAITNNLPCLCTLFNTPGLLPAFGINVTQALELPGRCGISGGFSACSAPTPAPAPVPYWEAPPSGSTTSNSATSPGSNNFNSATSPGSTTSNSARSPAPTSDVSRTVSTGIFSCFLLMFTAAMLY